MRRLKRARLDRVKYSHISLRFGLWVDLACAGTDTREIARAYGVSVNEVAHILERHGVGRPGGRGPGSLGRAPRGVAR
ncbi:MAG TPA: hypothetical protein VE959_38480 [Bryobacteraceae bacterium]|nr:hypothetical protein [Bryobacteraceae bacterium]